MTHPVYRLRMRHLFAYGLIAFVIGPAALGLLTMTTYGTWAYEGINLKTALYQVIFGSLGGGNVAVVLAFAYIRSGRRSRRWRRIG
jgi:hypothetical protein